ncbi:hypothetical protein [Flavivirga jejuensis]|uniref:Uncharacterized protein n=1 Tax=Flavivirga jejuensis TaxID=870487 RepID=A0ABT8WS22_9FLAO|nr:hypothetical protein [Flavivirga jejuensis]MDO5975997.1 hypothetical protein [Flavivirga jejuensis]
MKDYEMHKLIVDNLISRYGDLKKMKTNNDALNTNVFLNIADFNSNNRFDFLDNELPILDCKCKNGNYILATTQSLYSLFEGKKYSMKYKEFLNSDKSYFSSNKEIAEGKTKVFKYNLKSGEVFFYEIDSFYPADIVHNQLVLSMRFNKYGNSGNGTD